MDLYTCNFSFLEVEEEGAQQVQSQSLLQMKKQEEREGERGGDKRRENIAKLKKHSVQGTEELTPGSF